MKPNKFSRCFASALLTMSAASASWSLGLGEARVQSAMGQPLMADIELLADAAELTSVRLGLASANDYRLQGMEMSPLLSGARVLLKKNEAGKNVAQIVGRVPVNDPYVQLILDGESATGKVRRAYSVFIDPSRPAASKLPGESSFIEVGKPMDLPSIQAGAVTVPGIKAQVAKPVASKSAGKDSADIGFTNIVESGVAPERIESVKGYGRKQAINHALFTIVPKGWKGFASDPGVKFANPVDWDGNRNWLMVLDGVLASAHLTAAVNWDKKEITFSSLQGGQGTQAADAAEKASVPSSSATMEPQRTSPDGATPNKEVVASGGADQQKSRVTALEKEIKDLQAKLAVSSEEITKAQTERTRLAAELVTIKKGQGHANDDLTRARAELHMAQSQLTQANERMATMQPAPLPGSAEKAQAASRATENEITSLREKLKSAEDNVDQAQKKVDDLQSALDIRGQQNAKLLSRLDLLQSDRSKQQSQSASAHLELQQSKLELEQAKAKSTELQATLDQSKIQLEKAQSKTVEFQSLASSAQADLLALRDQMSQMGKNNSDSVVALNDELQTLKKKLAAEEQARAKAEEASKTLSASLQAVQQRLISQTHVFPKKEEPVQMPNMSRLTLVGPALSGVTPVMTSGMNVAFPNAIKQIIPQGWMVTSDPSIGNLAVGWDGASRPWTSVLDDVLKSKGLKAKVDSVSNEVFITR